MRSHLVRPDGIANELVQQMMSDPAGGIVYVTGTLSSGKTQTALLLADQLNRFRQSVILAQPDVDRADVQPQQMQSRAGLFAPCIALATSADIVRASAACRFLLVDEPQFAAGSLQEMLIEEAQRRRAFGRWTLFFGLRTSALRIEFPFATRVSAEADTLIELAATCAKCHQSGATFSQRLLDGKPAPASLPLLLSPDERIRYEPRCANCHELPCE